MNSGSSVSEKIVSAQGYSAEYDTWEPARNLDGGLVSGQFCFVQLFVSSFLCTNGTILQSKTKNLPLKNAGFGCRFQRKMEETAC